MYRLNKLLLKTAISILCLFLSFPLGLFAQNCECKKEHRKIVEKEKKRWQRGDYKDELTIKQHPYTTFSKFHSGSYYEKGTNAISRLTSLRCQTTSKLIDYLEGAYQ